MFHCERCTYGHIVDRQIEHRINDHHVANDMIGNWPWSLVSPLGAGVKVYIHTLYMYEGGWL